MNRRHILLSLFFLFALLNLPACQKGAGDAESAPGADTEQLPLDVIELSETAMSHAKLGIESAKPSVIHQALSLQGEVKPIPEKLAAIVARLEGVVTKVSKKEGDQVKTGEVMVTIESKKLAESKLAYLEAEHKLRFAKEALAREAQLMEKKISSKETYQKVAHEREEAELAHASALQNLKLLGFSEAFLHSLEKNPNQKMTRYTLRAPFNGEVISKDVTMGEAVVEEKTLFKLADLSELLVEIKVPIQSVPLFEKGKTVRVVCDAIGTQVDGTVSFVASMAESQTRTVPVRITIPNTEGKWRPGMPARVEMENADLKADVTVPKSAVHDIAGDPAVFVQVGDTAFRKVTITPGAKDDALFEVKSGISVGDKVAAKNSLTLKAEWLKREGE